MELLPEEMIDLIASFSDTPTRASLCLLSQKFNRIVEPHLYTDIYVDYKPGNGEDGKPLKSHILDVISSRSHLKYMCRKLTLSSEQFRHLGDMHENSCIREIFLMFPKVEHLRIQDRKSELCTLLLHALNSDHLSVFLGSPGVTFPFLKVLDLNLNYQRCMELVEIFKSPCIEHVKLRLVTQYSKIAPEAAYTAAKWRDSLDRPIHSPVKHLTFIHYIPDEKMRDIPDGLSVISAACPELQSLWFGGEAGVVNFGLGSFFLRGVLGKFRSQMIHGNLKHVHVTERNMIRPKFYGVRSNYHEMQEIRSNSRIETLEVTARMLFEKHKGQRKVGLDFTLPRTLKKLILCLPLPNDDEGNIRPKVSSNTSKEGLEVVKQLQKLAATDFRKYLPNLETIKLVMYRHHNWYVIYHVKILRKALLTCGVRLEVECD
ncbi:hypothetical protein BS50DRAFT_593530 [Corynespora cassiicola Philippines]|uniref:F-box domain-containing protein n=1 Tax=Corynespora cassiicola Philippines TaxID=1448308 RepID=A0A2T2N5S1_CORCC|nr:hypothetical protein BS50DRAFT_593530 [Corynespora cassiicola Philippines]